MNIEKYFEEYFQELKNIEKRMFKHYKNLSESVEDEELKSKFRSLLKEEKEHSDNWEEIKEILKKEQNKTTKTQTLHPTKIVDILIPISLILSAIAILLALISHL